MVLSRVPLLCLVELYLKQRKKEETLLIADVVSAPDILRFLFTSFPEVWVDDWCSCANSTLSCWHSPCGWVIAFLSCSLKEIDEDGYILI